MSNNFNEFNNYQNSNLTKEEFNEVPSNFKAKEFQSESETIKKFQTLMLGVSAVAVVGVGSIISTPTTANIINLEATNTTINYEVDVCDNDEDLVLILANDFTNRVIELEDGLNKGVISNLKENMYYTFSIISNDSLTKKELVKQDIRTLKAEEVKHTILYSVEHVCKCNIDGCFYFKMDFVDENNYWSNFEATLTDKFGNIANSIFSDDLSSWQKIDVIENELAGNRAVFTISCISKENSELVEEIVLYSVEVKI